MDTPAVDHLMTAYYHEDFDSQGGVWGTLDLFSNEEPELTARLPEEISRILRKHPDEESLEGFLDSLGSSVYVAPEEGGYRGWLQEISERVLSG